MLGWEVNESKCDSPAQTSIFLGGKLDTNHQSSGICTKSLDEMRKKHVANMCAEIEHHKGPIRVEKIMSLLGLLAFCGSIIEDARTWLRAGFDNIRGKQKHEFVLLTANFRKSLAYWRKLVTISNPVTTIRRREVTTMFASWDASTEWGMGGFLDGEFFAVKWTELLSSPGTKPFYPKPGTESWHINYMELFAGYWFIRKWGPKLTGMKLICWTDNSATEGMLKNMFGKATFIPLLKEILLLLRKYDMEMEPKHISSKDNIISDCLSRGDRVGFQKAVKDWSNVSIMDKDMEDWQLLHEIFEDLQTNFGPFDVDACVDVLRTNSHCVRSWNEIDDCTKQDWAGLNVYCNGPFSKLLQITETFIKCKESCQVGTSAVFVVPCWPSEKFYQVMMSQPDRFKVVRRWPTGTPLFTAPVPIQLGGGRIYQGPTKWPVVAIRVGPHKC